MAAPECAVAHAAGTSRQRVARANPGSLMRSKSVLALESRVLFDGAMLVTAIEQDSAPAAPEIPDVDVDEPVEDVAEATATESTEASVETAAEDAAEVPGDTATDPAASDVAADADTEAESDTATPPAVEPVSPPARKSCSSTVA